MWGLQISSLVVLRVCWSVTFSRSHTQEHNKIRDHERQLAKQRAQQGKWFADRKAENEQRMIAGKEELPNEADPSLPIFKPLQVVGKNTTHMDFNILPLPRFVLVYRSHPDWKRYFYPTKSTHFVTRSPIASFSAYVLKAFIFCRIPSHMQINVAAGQGFTKLFVAGSLHKDAE